MPEKPVNVLIMHPLAEQYRQQIRQVSSRVRVQDVSGLVAGEKQGDTTSRQRLDAVLAEAEVIYGFPPENVMARAPHLKWLQSHLAGVERFLVPDIIKSDVILTSSKGIHGTQVSELAFTMMLMLAKQAQRWFQLKQEKSWQPFAPPVLHAKTLGVLGLGNIGQEVARLGRAFGMQVIALEARSMEKPEYVDIILPPNNLRELLSQSDFVVITLPLTPETKGLVGEAELKAMKPTAYLINVARGGIVDEEALLHALSEKRIAGAGLDVFGTEPLPPESRFWEMPNVIMSPHIAGRREDYDVFATGLFCENLERYLNGRPLLNVIDKQKGF